MANVPASVVKQAKALGLDLDRCTIEGGTLAEVAKVQDAKPIYRSKTEALFADYLERDKCAGIIRGWWYEPCKFKLSEPDPQTKRGRTYCPDFLVWWPDGTLEYVEVKGGYAWEDALKTFDWARATFPMFRWRMVAYKSGVWTTIRGEDKV